MRHFAVTETGIEIGCNKCGKIKTSDKFYVKYKEFAPNQVSHWQEKCIDCATEYRRQHYTENSQAINAARKIYYYANRDTELEKQNARKLAQSSNPERILRRRAVQALPLTERYIHNRCIQWKSQAERRGLQWLLDEKIVLEIFQKQRGLCFYTRQPLVLAPKHRNTLSIDRVDPDRGYELDNVVLCGALVNKMKLDLSLSEFRSMVDLLHSTLPQLDED